MTKERRIASIANDMLEVIDFSNAGVPATKVEDMMMQAVPFSLFVYALNMLIASGLVYIDPQHCIHRVQT